jgi:methylated-DNA-protein-cysteine methyltransferase-like protein
MKTATRKRNERIWATIRDIPQGCVASYGQIAEIAGVPRGARQVGYALRHFMMEDVAILEGRIDMQKYRWQPDLDELLWKPSAAWDDE